MSVKKLYLMRHAKSDCGSAILKDFDRPLNERGSRVAPKMGTYYFEHTLKPDLILCSPAKRTRLTLDFVSNTAKWKGIPTIFEHSIYEASLASLIQVVEKIPDSYHEVCMIGHNPGLGLLVDYYTSQMVDMPTCATACIEFQVDSWNHVSKHSGQLTWYIYPKGLGFE